MYAVEAGEIIGMARQLAKDNGFADRIVFLHRDVREISELELVDIITSELISNSGPGENMAEVINFCRDRCLKPGGKILPRQVELCLAPLDDSQTYRQACLPEPAAYGVDFSSLQPHSVNLPLQAKIAAHSLLAAGQSAYKAAAATVQDTIPGVSGSVNYSITIDQSSGSFNGTFTFSPGKPPLPLPYPDR